MPNSRTRSFSLLAISAALLGGCFTNVNTSSSNYLAPEQAQAALKASTDSAALAITKLFSTRGYALADRSGDGPRGGIWLTMTGKRANFGHLSDHEIASVFYARISPTASGTVVSLIGKATLDGAIPCTNDKYLPGQCTKVKVIPELANMMTGNEEASVIHGVLTELGMHSAELTPPTSEEIAAFQASSAQPTPSGAAPQQPSSGDPVRDACLKQRADIAAQAQTVADPTERYNLLKTMPTCFVVVQQQ